MTIDIEYEATFTNVDKNDIRNRLIKIGAKLVKPDFLQKRIVFELPSGHEIPGAWLRVRDEQDQITMSLKIVDGHEIHNQKEVCLKINDFNAGVIFLEQLGAKQKAFQESRRELWMFNDVEITIDEWPYLEPYVEVEGKSEEAVKQVSKILDFDYTQAVFGSVDTLYHNKYGTPLDYINHHLKSITFLGPNPFI